MLALIISWFFKSIFSFNYSLTFLAKLLSDHFLLIFCAIFSIKSAFDFLPQFFRLFFHLLPLIVYRAIFGSVFGTMYCWGHVSTCFCANFLDNFYVNFWRGFLIFNQDFPLICWHNFNAKNILISGIYFH